MHSARQEKWSILKWKLAYVYKLGFYGFLVKLIRKISIGFLSVLFLPISLVLYFLGYRRLCVFTERVGHLAVEPDTILKGQILGCIKKYNWVILAPEYCVSNQHLLNYWKRHFIVVQSTSLSFILECMFFWPFVRHDLSYIINKSNHAQYAYKINSDWGERGPVLTLTKEDTEFATDALREMGVPDDAWFVCLHVRDGGYFPADESLHNHRNGSVENLIPAIKEITSRGGWVVRLGDISSKPIESMKNVIDYAHHPIRNPRLDVVLCAKARFMLANTSGIFLVGSIFGVPSVLVNMIPMPTLGLLHNDISIPKLYRSAEDKRQLGFSEVMGSNLSHYRLAEFFIKNGVIIEENSSSDILNATCEMLDMLDGGLKYTPDDVALHDSYMSLFNPNHYSYGAASRISINFLRKYKSLLRCY